MDSNHWDSIYLKKSENEVSWYQKVPVKSLELINEMKLAPDDSIIDIGGGESHLVDQLLLKGFQNITVLDISSIALDKVKARLGDSSKSVKFITSDVTTFNPPEKYRLWHDRATFHFLTDSKSVETYLEVANGAISAGGYLIVSTFSKTGPEKCSGLPVVQYADSDLKALFRKYFANIKCIDETHATPWGTSQNFVYCGFKKL
jgi:ubiquinone/menaquinone biosynthesis C-methylase UbiE